jgi:AcrR family transcriptional regulator
MSIPLPPTTPLAPPARRYGGASAEERQAQRRERLIESAFDVFGREGYLRATMRLICAQARLTERYFYESFATMEELFTAVHRQQSALVGQRIMAAVLQQNTDDGVAQTRAGLTAFFEFIKADPRCAQILLIDAVTAGMATPQNLNAKVAQYAALLKGRLGQRYPLMQDQLEVEYIVAGFVGMIIQTGSLWVQRGFDIPVERVVDHNLYAWIGLHEWLSRARPGPEQAVPQSL